MTLLFREEPKTAVPLHKMPGYVSDLHQRVHGELLNQVCATCELVWPCPGVRRQLADARRFTNDFWSDEKRFGEITKQVVRENKAEASRKKKTKEAA